MDLRKLIEELTNEHKEYILKMDKFEKQLEEDFNENLLRGILNFLNIDIQKHAEKEEENLNEEVENIYPEFDSEAIAFAHNILDEAIDDLRWDIKNSGNKEKIKKQIKKIFKMLKDHFSEEENFLFPNIYKEKKEWV